MGALSGMAHWLTGMWSPDRSACQPALESDWYNVAKSVKADASNEMNQRCAWSSGGMSTRIHKAPPCNRKERGRSMGWSWSVPIAATSSIVALPDGSIQNVAWVVRSDSGGVAALAIPMPKNHASTVTRLSPILARPVRRGRTGFLKVKVGADIGLLFLDWSGWKLQGNRIMQAAIRPGLQWPPGIQEALLAVAAYFREHRHRCCQKHASENSLCR